MEVGRSHIAHVPVSITVSYALTQQLEGRLGQLGVTQISE